MTPIWRRALALLAVALLAALPSWLDTLSAPPTQGALSLALVGRTVDDPQARAVALPHRWLTGCEDCDVAWYGFDLPREQAPGEDLALFLADVGHNAAVYFNGRLLGSGGRFAEPAARLGRRALMLPIPPYLWAEGDNQLYVLVKSERARLGRMPVPILAAEASLTPAARWRHWTAQLLPQLVATASALMALVMGLLWVRRRQDRMFAALAAMSLAWAVHGFSALVLEPPLTRMAWDAWLSATLAAWAVATAALVWQWTQSRPSPRWALALAMAAVLVAALSSLDRSGRALEWASAGSWCLAALAAGGLFRSGWGPADVGRLLPGGLLLAQAGASMVAAAMTSALLPTTVALIGVPVLIGVSSWVLLRRFVDSLNAAELLNVDLESMVQARTAELQAQFHRVRDLERAQTLATERERLMRDMHDGVGGHLVSLLAMIEADRRRPAELGTVVREALDDMRLMIDSFEPVDDDLNAVLAMWHDRLAPRLRGAKVQLQWDVDLLPQVRGLTPARVLHVLRILQEAVTNAIRHGQARELWISAHDETEGVRVVVRDDGAGFDALTTTSGRGLKNMQRRASEVGATLAIDSRAGQGTCVTLTLARA